MSLLTAQQASTILRAADLLDEQAQTLAESYTVDGEWSDDEATQQARQEHDELRLYARLLREMEAVA